MADVTGPRSTASVPAFMVKKGLTAMARAHMDKQAKAARRRRPKGRK